MRHSFDEFIIFHSLCASWIEHYYVLLLWVFLRADPYDFSRVPLLWDDFFIRLNYGCIRFLETWKQDFHWPIDTGLSGHPTEYSLRLERPTSVVIYIYFFWLFKRNLLASIIVVIRDSLKNWRKKIELPIKSYEVEFEGVGTGNVGLYSLDFWFVFFEIFMQVREGCKKGIELREGGRGRGASREIEYKLRARQRGACVQSSERTYIHIRCRV